MSLQEFSLGGCFHSLGNHFKPQVVCHAYDGIDDHRIGSLNPNIADKGLINLELVQW